MTRAYHAMAALLVALGAFGGGSPLQADSFRTAKVTVCANRLADVSSPCSELQGPFSVFDRRKFSAKRIDVKVTIICEGDALALLRKNGFLPVYIGVYRDGVRKDEDMEIGIKQENWDRDGAALSALYEENGNFSWRTRFYINMHEANTIGFQVNDATGKTTLLGSDPAELTIEFTN